MNAALPAMPLIDIRQGGPPYHAQQRLAQARALRDACLGLFPRALLGCLPVLDCAARRWLRRSRSPYVAEIGRIAEILGFPGVWLLNASYQWACTALAREEGGVPWLVRTLDWPFEGLGRHSEVAHMRGEAGDFFSVTWPGYAGVLTAMAPLRFAACVNQAPTRRRFSHPWLRPYDYAINAVASLGSAGRIPPDQLLRRAFEICEDYGAARRMLESTPVARPVIYALAGCSAGERCVIERTETGFVTRHDATDAANDWVPERPRWEGRISLRHFLSISFAQAGASSKARRDALAAWSGSLADAGFGWVQPPVLNPYTRLAVAMCPAGGSLQAIGYDVAGADLPSRVTQMFDVAAASCARP